MKKNEILFVLIFLYSCCHFSCVDITRGHRKHNLCYQHHSPLSSILLSQQHYPDNNVLYISYFENDQVGNGRQKLHIEPATPASQRVKESSVAVWNDLLNLTGWIHFYVSFQKSDSIREDARKTYLAGVLEGYLSHKRLSQFHTNVYGLHSKSPSGNFKLSAIFKTLQRSLQFIRSTVGWNFKDPFASKAITDTGSSVVMKQMIFILLQLHGVADGYNALLESSISPQTPLSVVDLLLLSADGDFDSLNYAAWECGDNPPKDKKSQGSSNTYVERKKKHSRCTAFIRWTNDDLFVGHTTWESYSEMTRVIKYYNFPYLDASAHTLAMTSYPGVITSTDDFILTSAGLAVVETSIDLTNNSILCDANRVRLAHAPDFMATLIASRLAKTPKEWIHIFGLSSAYCQNLASYQWMVVGFPHGHSRQHVVKKKPILFVLEVVPGSRLARDESSFLLQQGYWASVNKASFPEIQNLIAQKDDINYGRDFIFSTAAKSINSLDDMQHIMQFSTHPNLEKKENKSFVLAVAPRFDLHGSYFDLEGATDTKIVNEKMMRELSFLAISGPPHQLDPPFQWSRVKKKKEGDPHIGLPDVWNFTWQHVTQSGLEPYTSVIPSNDGTAWEQALKRRARDYMMRLKPHAYNAV